MLACVLFVVSTYVGTDDGAESEWVRTMEGVIAALFVLDYAMCLIASGARGAHGRRAYACAHARALRRCGAALRAQSGAWRTWFPRTRSLRC